MIKALRAGDNKRLATILKATDEADVFDYLTAPGEDSEHNTGLTLVTQAETLRVILNSFPLQNHRVNLLLSRASRENLLFPEKNQLALFHILSWEKIATFERLEQFVNVIRDCLDQGMQMRLMQTPNLNGENFFHWLLKLTHRRS